MKKKILFLSIALTSFVAFGFAADAPAVNKNVIHSFNQQFSDAKNVKWENRKNFVKAEFMVKDQVMFAYFNANAELIAVTRFIASTQLPEYLVSSLKKNFNGFWISDLFEIQTDAGTDYYATLENADHIMVVKSEGGNDWQTFQNVSR